MLNEKCGVAFQYNSQFKQMDYITAVKQKVDAKNIVSVGKIDGKVIFYFLNENLATQCILEGLYIENVFVEAYPITKRPTRIVLSNIHPQIPDKPLMDYLKNFGEITKAGIKPIPINSGGDPDIKHIISYRRELYMHLNENVAIPSTITVVLNDLEFTIFVSVESSQISRPSNSVQNRLRSSEFPLLTSPNQPQCPSEAESFIHPQNPPTQQPISSINTSPINLTPPRPPTQSTPAPSTSTINIPPSHQSTPTTINTDQQSTEQQSTKKRKNDNLSLQQPPSKVTLSDPQINADALIDQDDPMENLNNETNENNLYANLSDVYDSESEKSSVSNFSVNSFEKKYTNCNFDDIVNLMKQTKSKRQNKCLDIVKKHTSDYEGLVKRLYDFRTFAQCNQIGDEKSHNVIQRLDRLIEVIEKNLLK
jgi:hypothetical protein